MIRWDGRVACADEPERWMAPRGNPDLEAVQLGLACPARRDCAEDASKDPEAYGLRAGVVLPWGRDSNSRYRRVLAVEELRRIANESLAC